MNLQDFAYEYDSLSDSRKLEGLKKLFDTYLSDIDRYSEEIGYVLESAQAAEAEDYFGTEGLDV